MPPIKARARLDRARRSATTGWLWPAVPIDAWQHALDRIARIASGVLTDGRSAEWLDGDEEAISVAGYTSGMGPLLGHWLEHDRFSASFAVRQRLDLHLRHNRLRMAKLFGQTATITRHLAEREVGAVVLKGMHTCMFFPEPGTRPLSDVDLLVTPEHHAAAVDALTRLGFVAGQKSSFPSQQNWRHVGAAKYPRSLGFVHAADPWSVDLQLSLDRRYCPGAPVVKLDAAYCSRSVEPLPMFAGAKCLSPAFLVLHLACHASCGLANLTMLRLVEIILVTRRCAELGRFAWADLLEIAQSAKLAAHAYPALRLCNELVSGTVPGEVLSACRKDAPPAVRHMIESLEPANAQKVVRWSLKEKFMWTRTRNITSQLLYEMFPGALSPAVLARLYRNRLSRLLTGVYIR